MAAKKKAAKRRTKPKGKELIPGAHYQGHGDDRYIELGEPHGFPAKLFMYHSYDRASLQVGCYVFDSEREARDHYKPGYRSEDAVDDKGNGHPRPHGQALVTYAAAICKTNGWKW